MALNQAQEYQQKSYPFGNKGLTTRIDASLLSEIQYLRLENMISIQEGALRSRNGYQLITSGGIAGETGTLDYVHSIARLYTGDPLDANNYIYVGNDEEVYRLTSEIPPAVVGSADTGRVFATQLATRTDMRRWSGVAYKKNSSGKPYMYIASSGRMKKDPIDDTQDGGFNEMQKWGIDRPLWPVAYIVEPAGYPAGNLVELFAQYNYVYTFRNPVTNHESNPSFPVIADNLRSFAGANGQLTLYFIGTSPEESLDNVYDLQIAGSGQLRNVVLYRSGGAFSDGLYRRVATLTLPGEPGTEFTFTDNVPDADIAANPIAEFDNDRPVTANLPRPFSATIDSITDLYLVWSGYPKKVSVRITIETGLEYGETNIADTLRPGGYVRVGTGTESEEFCVIGSLVSSEPPYEFITVFQRAHVAGETIQTASVANQPCPFSCTAFNSLFLAGDRNNPNVLYKSKPGRPESFPAVINEADGSPGSIEVGTPSDPIMNICEYGGNVLCLNKAHLYIVQMYNGYMQAPVKTLAQRGLMNHWAWCKVDNDIWYLAYDGIYSWNGGESVKRSEAIDHIFKGEFLSGYYPISLDPDGSGDPNGLSDLDKVLFTYRKNQVLVSYIDTEGDPRRLRYDLIYDRWDMENTAVDAAQFEEDSGRLVLATNSGGVAHLNLDDTPGSEASPATTDGWTDLLDHDDGAPIAWEAWSGWYMMGMPTMQKQFGDVILELANVETEVTVQVYYDFSGTLEEAFTIAAAPTAGRHRYVMSLQSAASQEAYAISLRITGTSVQPVALYTLTFNFLTLEQIQHGRAGDWDNLGYPHDKRLTQVSIEYDVAGTDAELQLDIMGGIGGSTPTLAVQTFTLSSPASTDSTGPLRGRTTFPINDGIVAKLVRLRPVETSHDVKIWNPNFDKVDYPPDKVLFTEWDDLGYGCEKSLREVELEVDTGGVEAEVNIQADGYTKRKFMVKTTMDKRHQIITLNREGDPELIGQQFRTLNVPGTGGKYQLFKIQFKGVREPCVLTFWDSLEQTFGYNGWKFSKRMWVKYRSCSPVLLRLYTDGKLLLHELEIPQHDRREVEQIYLPVSTGVVLNKSKTYRLTLASVDPCCGFYLYAEATRMEWMPVGADMRQGYQQAPWSVEMERQSMP